MEYNIRSNDDSVNQVILAALEDLDNTFFVEYSDSEDKEFDSVSDSESISDNDIPSSKLNEFNFVDVSENYIEDKIYDDLKKKVKNFFEKGKCSCRSKQTCFEQIGYERFLARRAAFESLEKDMRDMVVKGQLLAFQKNEDSKRVTNDNRKNFRFKYCYNSDISVCFDTYLNLVGVTRKYLNNIKEHLQKHGLEERIHGNTGRAPKNMNRIEVNYDLACYIYKFLKNYSNIHGMPSPGRHCNKITMPIVFLPTSFSYASVYRDYVQAYKDKYGEDTRVLAESTFTNIWKSLMPSLQFMSAKTDLCETCEIMKMDIQYATQHEKKLELTNNYLAHLNRAQEELHLFGVCNTGNFPHTQQTNYVIDEAEMPDDGKQGQNKNNYSLFFYSWLIDRNMYDEIELNFMIPGHTKFICDGCFGLIKILYRKSKVNTVDDVVSVVNRSTRINFNVAQRYFNGEGFQYYDFKNYFQTFKKLPNIQKYHHFYFNSQYPGVVFYKDDLKDNYKNFIIRSFFFNTNTLPSIISTRPLSLKRQEELHKEIAPYVDLPFRDITCPEPPKNLK
ncbi:43357_t:CDS:2 [Gigaspora margarita]|uniref:43357_t:CDS:1 n=1 Tax=Gigaspora margarita TaxID=4874 RepID=A0ABN7W6S2_GIGMA|nr:43357_t:CDS:2 [Gigaspora margarita]